VISKATPATPQILPRALRSGSTRALNVWPRMRISYAVGVPSSAARCAATARLACVASSAACPTWRSVSGTGIGPRTERPPPRREVTRNVSSVDQSSTGSWSTRRPSCSGSSVPKAVAEKVATSAIRVQHVPHLAGERIRREWLLEEGAPQGRLPVLHDRVARIPRHIEHPRAGTARGELIRQIAPGHAGHHDVGE